MRFDISKGLLAKYWYYPVMYFMYSWELIGHRAHSTQLDFVCAFNTLLRNTIKYFAHIILEHKLNNKKMINTITSGKKCRI